MTPTRTVKALAFFATIAATIFLGGAERDCTAIGDACVPGQTDIDAGCASAGMVGFCIPTENAPGLDFLCVAPDADGLSGQECGDGVQCLCFFGSCVKEDATGYCDSPIGQTPGTGSDPHMIGLQGQKIDWKGHDGGWYALLSERENGVQISVRLTAPLAAEYSERQLITGFALKGTDGHSLVIQTKDPYTVQTTGCREDVNTPCLSEDALEITVDGEDREAVPVESVLLPGGTVMTAVNLPAECQPYGGDVIWATNFAKMAEDRRLADVEDVDEWVLGWSATTAAPSWCEKYIADSGAEGLLDYRSQHAVFRIETPSFTVRLHHGTNHQGGEVLQDGRVLPELKFWEMDIHLEWADLNADTVTGILGETIRPVLDSVGRSIMSGIEARRGGVEDYRVSGPLESDFPGFHE